ncbi:hypothetical protein LCGC14_1913760 [marine sediment metagenome]|uniref:DUF2958 domain-containing protein n=1 Tax=marine sediment metagenome TaxID=412755 RepID=A0A0F9FTG1_9ZZZZ
MKMLTKANRKALPKLYTNEEKPLSEAMAVVKFFTPWTYWTWYASEGEPVLDDQGNEIDFKFFGLVDGHEMELGYFLLSELESMAGRFGLKIERDMHWKPKSLQAIMDGDK